MALLSLHRNLKMLRQGWAKPELPFDCSLHFVFEMWVKIRNGNYAPPLWIAALVNLLAGVQGVPKWRASVSTGQARWAVSGHETKNTEPFYSKYHKLSISGSHCSLDCREEESWKTQAKDSRRTNQSLGHCKLAAIPGNNKRKVLRQNISQQLMDLDIRKKSKAGGCKGRISQNFTYVWTLSLTCTFKRSTLELKMQFSGGAHA